MTPVNWAQWRKCTVCFAEIGEPCTYLTGQFRDGRRIRMPEDRPHRSRKPRTGATT